MGGNPTGCVSNWVLETRVTATNERVFAVTAVTHTEGRTADVPRVRHRADILRINWGNARER